LGGETTGRVDTVKLRRSVIVSTMCQCPFKGSDGQKLSGEALLTLTRNGLGKKMRKSSPSIKWKIEGRAKPEKATLERVRQRPKLGQRK